MDLLRNISKYLAVALLMFSAINVVASTGKPVAPVDGHKHHTEEHGGIVDTKDEIDAYKQHHLADAHDFHLFSYGGENGEHRHHVGFALPVIIYTSEGLKTFASSEFHHDDNGQQIVDVDGLKIVKVHSKIYELNKGEVAVKFDADHHVSNGKRVLDFSITKTVVGMLLTALIMFLAFASLARGYKKGPIPTGFARVLEPLVIYVRDEIARPNIGEKKYRKYMGFLLTVFFFIWITNLVGLTPLGFNVTGNIAVTACLSLFTFFIITFTANKDYWKHIFWMPGVPVPMKFVLMPIEVLGMFTKPFSLLIRLFANITAGHAVVMGLIAVSYTAQQAIGVPGAFGVSFMLSLFITLIEVLVAFLQAFIFTMLSSLFIGMAVEEHDHH